MKKIIILAAAISFILMPDIFSQDFRITPGDTLTSVVLHPDNTVTFSIYAPDAENVSLGGTDIPGIFNTGKGRMTKQENGIWEVTVGPVEAGAYRYNFNVDGVSVVDPRSSVISESNMNVWSLLYVPGASFMEIKNIPRGAVSEVTYFSTTLNRYRRMHVYTPPGYEKGNDYFPVFYLLHGAFDCDDSWSTVGRAGFILDNLIAEKKAVPMIVVMPAGHTGPFRPGMRFNAMEEFEGDFRNDIVPLIEKNYRILNKREDRAIAGLSMGGAQTINISIPDLDQYGYIGVFSSGVFGITGGSSGEGMNWEKNNLAILDNEELKKGLRLVWFATGNEDFLLETSRETVKVLKKHGFDVTYVETSGGHTWKNWREYLYEFAQLLFK